MAKAVFKAGALTVGLAQLGMHGDRRGSVRQQTHDGDTVSVEAAGNLGVRFLGVDAPEVSFTLPQEAVAVADRRPGEDQFVSIADPRWDEFLTDPFADTLPAFREPLEPELEAHLRSHTGPGTAANHARLAAAAHLRLEAEIEADMAELGQDVESFRFFLAFASEVMDGYGRFLGFLNRSQRQRPRPPSYNERLLQQGQVTPYFIWPNLDPYRRQPALVDAVAEAGRLAPPGVSVEAKRPLDDARQWVRTAREQGRGVYAAEDPLRLLPFELRFVSRRTPPDRWVIDLGAGDDRLLHPQLYVTIPNPEDRLFVPAQYVPLFESKGWRTIMP